MNFRIVRDNYNGFEVQKLNELGTWVQLGGTNTHRTLEDARRYARDFIDPVVEYLDAKGNPCKTPHF